MSAASFLIASDGADKLVRPQASKASRGAGPGRRVARLPRSVDPSTVPPGSAARATTSDCGGVRKHLDPLEKQTSPAPRKPPPAGPTFTDPAPFPVRSGDSVTVASDANVVNSTTLAPRTSCVQRGNRGRLPVGADRCMVRVYRLRTAVFRLPESTMNSSIGRILHGSVACGPAQATLGSESPATWRLPDGPRHLSEGAGHAAGAPRAGRGN